MKNLYLFISIEFISFKVIPSRYNALMPTFFPIVETVVKFDFQNCLQSLLRFGLYLFNRVKKSGEYGGCWTICVEFLAKWSRRTSAVWNGALSWCKNHELSVQITFETVLSDPLEIPIVSARFLIVIRRFMCTNSLIWFSVARHLMLMVVRGVPKNQHVLCLLWSLCTTYKHFSATLSNHRRPSATFRTFPLLKFHSANRI